MPASRFARKPYLAFARCGRCGSYDLALIVPLVGGDRSLFCEGCGADGRPDSGRFTFDPPHYDPADRRPKRRSVRLPRPTGRPRKAA